MSNLEELNNLKFRDGNYILPSYLKESIEIELETIKSLETKIKELTKTGSEMIKEREIIIKTQKSLLDEAKKELDEFRRSTNKYLAEDIKNIKSGRVYQIQCDGYWLTSSYWKDYEINMAKVNVLEGIIDEHKITKKPIKKLIIQRAQAFAFIMHKMEEDKNAKRKDQKNS